MKTTFYKLLMFTLLFAIINAYDGSDFPERLYPVDDSPKSYKNIKDKYFISLHFLQNKYPLDEQIVMEVKIHSKSGNISFNSSLNPYENYQFIVYDSKNNRVYSSISHSLWQHRDINIENKDKTISLSSGEYYAHKINLHNWFEFSKPDRYRIVGYFNPTPGDNHNYKIKTETVYFYVGESRYKRKAATGIYVKDKKLEEAEKKLEPLEIPPYEVIERTLSALQLKKWDEYFRNTHIPSLITANRIYNMEYFNRFGYNEENFRDRNEIHKWNTRSSLKGYVKRHYDNPEARKQMSDASVSNAFFSARMEESVNQLEERYRTAVPKEKNKIYNQYKKYVASMFDRRFRLIFLNAISKEIEMSNDPNEKKYLKTIYNSIDQEYTSDEIYYLDEYKIEKTTIENIRGIDTAYITAILSQKYIKARAKDIYKFKVRRNYTLKKLGDYWYIVDYTDGIINDN